MNEQLVRLREWFEKLAPRERRLMAWLGIALAVFILLLVPVGTQLILSARRESNKAVREAIVAIKNARDEVRQRQAKREAIIARYSNRAPPLAGMLDKAARDNKLDVLETRDNPEVPHGKKYVERSTVVRLRKVGMLQLGKTLEALEQQHLPVAISRLNIRRRGGERDSYDIELGASAFDRDGSKDKEAAPTGEAPSGGSK
jgi:general secretion pathway protein M